MNHYLGSMPQTEAQEASLAEVTDAMRAEAPISPERTEDDRPRGSMPQIGDTVIYCPRPGEFTGKVRNGAAALVLYTDEEKRTCDLYIFRDVDDVLGQQRVPEQTVEGERGWKLRDVPNVIINHAPREIAEVRKEIAELRALVLGEYEPLLGSSVFEMIESLDERLDKIERAAKTAPMRAAKAAKAAKRGM